MYQWSQIENVSFPTGSVKDYLAISPFHSQTAEVRILFLDSSFYNLEQICNPQWGFCPSGDIVPITSLQILIPHFSLSAWLSCGISHMSQLYSGRTLFSQFTSLSSSFYLPNSLFYQYLQIRHALQSITLILKPKTLPPFHRYFMGHSGLKEGLSKIYTILMVSSISSKLKHHSQWELELSTPFSSIDWIEASTSSLKLSRCVDHSELMRKIHLKWHLTPVRLAYMSSTSTRFCWTRCGQVGTLLHMWWSCPPNFHLLGGNYGPYS